MIHIVYKTTNTVNGKFYIGKHSTDNLNDGYLGSGVILTRAVKKHGKQRFVREIIRQFDDESEAYRFERELIESIGLDPTKCYNVCYGGVGFWKGMTHTAEARAKISAANKGRKMAPGFSAKMSELMKGRKVSDETKQKLSALNAGKKLSDEVRAKISAGGKGRVVSEEVRRRISASQIGRVSPQKGAVLSDSTKKKMSLARQGVKASDETKDKIRQATSGSNNAGFGKIWITDGENNTRVVKGDKIPDGWWQGRALRPYKLKQKD